MRRLVLILGCLIVTIRLYAGPFLPGRIYDLDHARRFDPFMWGAGKERVANPSSPLAQGFLIMFKFYRDVLSPLDGPKCPYYPTCSQFGVEAVRKYGVFWGLLMLFNRQMREYPNLLKDRWYPLVIKHGVLRAYDPPDRAYLWSEVRDEK